MSHRLPNILLVLPAVTAACAEPDLTGDWIGILTDEATGEELALEWRLRPGSGLEPGVLTWRVEGGIPERGLTYSSDLKNLAVCTRASCPTIDAHFEVFNREHLRSSADAAERGSLRHDAQMGPSFADEFRFLVLAAEPEDHFRRYVGTFWIADRGLEFFGTAELERR